MFWESLAAGRGIPGCSMRWRFYQHVIFNLSKFFVWSLLLFSVRIPGNAAHWPEMTVSWLGVTVQVHSLDTIFKILKLCEKLDPPLLWVPRSLLTRQSHWSNLGRFLSHYFAWYNSPSSEVTRLLINDSFKENKINKTYRAQFEGSIDIILVFLNFLPEPHGLVIFYWVDILWS